MICDFRDILYQLFIFISVIKVINSGNYLENMKNVGRRFIIIIIIIIILFSYLQV